MDRPLVSAKDAQFCRSLGEIAISS